jgi:uncharacterized membrane protein
MCVSVCVPLLHKRNPCKSAYSEGPTPLDVSQFLGPDAALFTKACVLPLLVINVIWAMRWLVGIETVCTDVYGLNGSQVATLLDCGRKHPRITMSSECNILSSFLFNQWPVYIHVIGATICLSLGPFQLSKGFRQQDLTRHRKLGYVYTSAMLVAVAGAVLLVAQTTSGMVAGSAFVVLGTLWLVTLARGIVSARAQQMDVHREWMIRNYCLTFAAVPFRFLPGVFLTFGVLPDSAYAAGAYLSIVLMSSVAECFVRGTRHAAATSDTGPSGGVSLMATLPPP